MLPTSGWFWPPEIIWQFQEIFWLSQLGVRVLLATSRYNPVVLLSKHSTMHGTAPNNKELPGSTCQDCWGWGTLLKVLDIQGVGHGYLYLQRSQIWMSLLPHVFFFFCTEIFFCCFWRLIVPCFKTNFDWGTNHVISGSVPPLGWVWN